MSVATVVEVAVPSAMPVVEDTTPEITTSGTTASWATLLTGGVGALGEWLGLRSLDPAGVLAAYRAQGHEITELAQVRGLGVADVLAVRPHLARAYAIAAAVQGGLTGALGGLVTARPVVVLATAAGVLGADSVLTTATCVRAVAHVGAYYGYDPRTEAERAVVLAVLATSLATPGNATVSAHAQLRALVRGATTTGPAAGTVVAQLSGPREFAPLVPALGIVLGALLTARLVARVVDDADHLYRERFLREKYGLG